MHNTPTPELINLTGKTAIVTGGAMGIGFGIAYRLASAGANVVIADMHEEAGTKAAQELKEAGWSAASIGTDVRVEAEVQRATEFAIQTFGGIDILVNNAGIYPIVPVMQMSVAEYERVMDINMKGVFLFTKAVAAALIQQGRGGKIINITSIDALHPSAIGLGVYDASKHGLWGFTKNTALELAPHKIWVNAIAPGSINTPGTNAGARTPEQEASQERFVQKVPMRRTGEPDDIGRAALFLASELSSYMTGAQVVVDGGVLLS